MREIVLVDLDKRRPALVLTRELVRPYTARVTVAPITTTAKGLSTELPLGPQNGLDHDCVASLDNVVTVPAGAVVGTVGTLLPSQERALAAAVVAAFDLNLDVSD